jgi:hypothetical protein
MLFLLHLFNLHVSSLDSYQDERKERKRLRKKLRYQKKKIKVLEDIALGIKRDDLNILYEHVKSFLYAEKKIIDKFTAASFAERSIFVS